MGGGNSRKVASQAATPKRLLSEEKAALGPGALQEELPAKQCRAAPSTTRGVSTASGTRAEARPPRLSQEDLGIRRVGQGKARKKLWRLPLPPHLLLQTAVHGVTLSLGEARTLSLR